MRRLVHTMASADFSLRCHRRPLRHEASSPQARTHYFTAQPPDLRRSALITRALRCLARSPCSGNAFYPILVHRLAVSLHASSPHSVTLMQLRFTSLAVINLRRDLHPQEYAHARRTTNKNPAILYGWQGFLMSSLNPSVLHSDD